MPQPWSGSGTAKWANATQGIPGQIVYLSAEDTVDFTTAVTNRPHGVLLNAPKQGESAQVNSPKDGDEIQILANGTTDLAAGDLLKTNSTGRGIKAGAKNATYIATEVWVVGRILQAFTADVDGLVTCKWGPLEGHWT